MVLVPSNACCALPVPVMGAVVAAYYLWHRHYIQPFSCQANFIQHHRDETLSLWLNYTVEGNSGILSMNGRLKSDPRRP